MPRIVCFTQTFKKFIKILLSSSKLEVNVKSINNNLSNSFFIKNMKIIHCMLRYNQQLEQQQNFAIDIKIGNFIDFGEHIEIILDFFKRNIWF